VLIDDLRARLPTFFDRDARDPDVYPGENVADLFALGVLAAPLPQAHGGGGATLEETVRLVEAIAQGGRHYRRAGKLSRYLADSFAGTALRPPLPLALESLVTDFAFDPTAE
jgi:alkylation response protein AidB-like acyl-CoA dehydrogenase